MEPADGRTGAGGEAVVLGACGAVSIAEDMGLLLPPCPAVLMAPENQNARCQKDTRARGFLAVV